MALGQLMVGIAGTELTDEETRLLRHPQVAGVILFSRNYADPAQLQRLTAAIHGLREPSLLVAVDQEGGRVQRFRDGLTRLPPAAVFGRLERENPGAGVAAARAGGWLMAAELLACGVDFSFAPVLDLDRGISAVIGDRAFHREPEAVARLAGAWIDGMHEAGMAATGKHFPGHGAVAPDSHNELPVDQRPELELRGSDMRPFETLMDAGQLDAVMTAHVAYPQADIRPASFSAHWVRAVLREDLGFDGVVVADDLDMEGAAAIGDLASRALAALEAGCDLLLLCNSLDAREEVLAALPPTPDPEACRRLAGLYPRTAAPSLSELKDSEAWRQARAFVEAL